MKHRYLMVLIATLLCLLTVSEITGQHLGQVHERMFLMRDSLQMYAWIHESPAGDEVPLIICLPQRGTTHRSFDRFYIDLVGYVRRHADDSLLLPHVMVLDLRGHGKSVHKDDSVVNYATMGEDEYRKIPLDVAGILEELDSFQEAPKRDQLLSKIGAGDKILLGASIGANSALLTTQHYPDIAGVVMLSPGEDYFGLTPLDAASEYDGRMLIVTARKDAYSHASSLKLAKAAGDNCELVKWGGDA
ncbi:alpha/beta fold hydrolase, partial [candidate division GN15 bacterium]|nr:alpha/beta fold hydrolase [candidate division GN15 bacterium]